MTLKRRHFDRSESGWTKFCALFKLEGARILPGSASYRVVPRSLLGKNKCSDIMPPSPPKTDIFLGIVEVSETAPPESVEA